MFNYDFFQLSVQKMYVIFVVISDQVSDICGVKLAVWALYHIFYNICVQEKLKISPKNKKRPQSAGRLFLFNDYKDKKLSNFPNSNMTNLIFLNRTMYIRFSV